MSETRRAPTPWKSIPTPKIVDADGNDVLASWKTAHDPDCLLLAAAPDLLAACKKAQLTYKALARTHQLILEAARTKGWDMGWLTQELEKTANIEDAIAKAEQP